MSFILLLVVTHKADVCSKHHQLIQDHQTNKLEKETLKYRK